ncbi:hypothetical protein F511_28527 [Dorcoceras hygrometricum]|uniref:Uncharacterized protein n=1 Tax=Dorcoceras hygrometricum TaxID=472368 RepID=A0A2Z7AM78_9LAMI|nr:hypothetical protein F511_28527 [Dorcoceras hygrometricum]
MHVVAKEITGTKTGDLTTRSSRSQWHIVKGNGGDPGGLNGKLKMVPFVEGEGATLNEIKNNRGVLITPPPPSIQATTLRVQGLPAHSLCPPHARIDHARWRQQMATSGSTRAQKRISNLQQSEDTSIGSDQDIKSSSELTPRSGCQSLFRADSQIRTSNPHLSDSQSRTTITGQHISK